jgi:hypothetical protein
MEISSASPAIGLSGQDNQIIHGSDVPGSAASHIIPCSIPQWLCHATAPMEGLTARSVGALPARSLG